MGRRYENPDDAVAAAPVQNFAFFRQPNLFNQAFGAQVHMVFGEDAFVRLKDKLALSQIGANQLALADRLGSLGEVVFKAFRPSIPSARHQSSPASKL